MSATPQSPLPPAGAEQLKIVILGHVDHGKSTLVGRLLHDTGSLPEGKLEQLQQIAERRRVPFEWANLMDALQAERDQNISIDTAQIWFHTQKRRYVIIDAPGHKEFIKNMVTGAAQAEAALLVIDAHEGVQENSRRHGYLLDLLGIRQVAVLVNKMDLVDYSQERFNAIEAEYRAWLAQVGLKPSRFIPISARQGDNIAAPGKQHALVEGADGGGDARRVQSRPVARRPAPAIPDSGRVSLRPPAHPGRARRERSHQGRRAAGLRPQQQDQHGEDHRALERPGARFRRGRRKHRDHPHRPGLRRSAGPSPRRRTRRPTRSPASRPGSSGWANSRSCRAGNTGSSSPRRKSNATSRSWSG